MKKEEKEDNGFWSEDYFAETMSSDEGKGKMRTFHMKHDEEMNFNCKSCNAKISAHNKDWHNGMCDKCFDDEYFPEGNDPFSEANSEGMCRLCNNGFKGGEIEKHMKECAAKSAGKIEAFLLKASRGPYWVYFSIPLSEKLAKIDQFLRDLWLECCGHLSAFEIKEA